MVTRRQQLQAHRFVVRRLASGVVGGDPGSSQPPGQRLKTGFVLGTAAGLLGIGGAAAYGLASPKPDTSWRDGKSVVVEQGTYNQYLYIGGVLHQVLNQASARLVLTTYAVKTVPASALEEVPRGKPVGIVGAPTDLPDASALLDGPWTVCSGTNAATGAPQVSAALGVDVTGTEVTDGQALYASVGDSRYLVWGGKRHLLRDALTVMSAFQMTAAQPVAVGAAWLNTLPAGSDLAPMTVGTRSGAGALGHVGDLYTYQDASGDYQYTVTPKGLTPITAAQAALLQAGGSPAPRPLATAALAEAKQANRVTAPLGGDLPAALPTTAVGGPDLCATVSSGVYRLHTATSAAVDGAGSWLTTGGGAGRADRVLVRPGTGALAAASAGGVAELLTPEGELFPVAAKEDLARLGYSAVTPTAVPAAVLGLFPEGPQLDAADALTPEPATESTP